MKSSETMVKGWWSKIEMTRLQRGVLPVVGEAEDLLRPRRQSVHIAEQIAQRGQGEHCRGRASAFGAEAGQLGEVASHRGVVVDVAVEAEPEGPGDDPAGQSAIALRAEGIGLEGQRRLTAVVWLQAGFAPLEGQPLFRKGFLDGCRLKRPVRIGHEVPGRRVIVGCRTLA